MKQNKKSQNFLTLPKDVYKYYPKNIWIWLGVTLSSVLLTTFIIHIFVNNGFSSLFSTGYFYTFAFSMIIANISMILNNLLIQKIDYDKIHFLGIKVILLLVSIFLVLFIVISYVATLINSSNMFYAEILQSFMFVLNLLLGIYVFSLSLLENPKVINNFIHLEDELIDNLVDDSHETSKDKEGNKL